MSAISDIMTGPLATDRRRSRIRAKAQKTFALLRAHLAVIGGRPAHDRIFGHLGDDVWFSINTAAYRRHAILRRLLPSLPDARTQADFIGAEGDRALQEAFRSYQLIRHIAGRCGRPISRQMRILDFGCGWGRMIRFFMRDVPTAQLYGVDVMPLAID